LLRFKLFNDTVLRSLNLNNNLFNQKNAEDIIVAERQMMYPNVLKLKLCHFEMTVFFKFNASAPGAIRYA